VGHVTHGAAWLLPVILCACVPAPAGAHAGPPFPIIVDERVGPWLASVWTDPDIGIGEFWVVLEPAGDAPLPGSTQVRVGVQPVSGRLPEAIYDAAPQPVRRGERHYTEVAFDRGEWWDVRIVVEYPEGRGELTAMVEATPDGQIGPIGMIFYLLPFLALAFIWLRVALRRRSESGRAGT
jgi:hypothetical protein